MQMLIFSFFFEILVLKYILNNMKSSRIHALHKYLIALLFKIPLLRSQVTCLNNRVKGFLVSSCSLLFKEFKKKNY